MNPQQRLTDVALQLRACVARGVPSWLLPTVQGCIAELDRLVAVDASERESAAVCVQARTLIEVCRSARSK